MNTETRAAELYAKADRLWQEAREYERIAQTNADKAKELNRQASDTYALATDLRFPRK